MTGRDWDDSAPGSVKGPGITSDMSKAYILLLRMTPEQRGLILCWFCDTCRKYVPPGQSCPHPEE